MEYELSPVLAAQEGDTRALCDRLRNSAVAITMAERRCAADLIEGKLKLPRHRPPSVKTRLRTIDIARRVEELTSKPGEREAAIAATAAEFKCRRSTVLSALKAHRCK
jgi:hypothetical protein